MAAPFPSPRHFSLVFLGFVGCRRVALWLRSSVCQDMTSSLSKLCFLLQAVLWVGFWLSSSFGKKNSTTLKKSLKITACYKIPPKKWYHVAGNDDWCLTGLSSAIACSSELGPRPTWRRVLGADFYKLPRATAMRTLSEVRARIVWILKLFSERQH